VVSFPLALLPITYTPPVVKEQHMWNVKRIIISGCPGPTRTLFMAISNLFRRTRLTGNLNSVNLASEFHNVRRKFTEQKAHM
jgi:hypothetical protein